MTARITSLFISATVLAACTSEEQIPAEAVAPAEIVEVRTWEAGCNNWRTNGRDSYPPDTIAYPPGHREAFRIVALGGCVDEYFYEQERHFFTVLDTLGVTDSLVTWPPDDRLRLAVTRSLANARPTPLDSAFTISLPAPGATGVAFFGFSDEFGLLWATVHNGPSFRLSRIERTSDGFTSLLWQDPHWPRGGPAADPERRGVAAFDSLWYVVQQALRAASAQRGT